MNNRGNASRIFTILLSVIIFIPGNFSLFRDGLFTRDDFQQSGQVLLFFKSITLVLDVILVFLIIIFFIRAKNRREMVKKKEEKDRIVREISEIKTKYCLKQIDYLNEPYSYAKNSYLEIVDIVEKIANRREEIRELKKQYKNCRRNVEIILFGEEFSNPEEEYNHLMSNLDNLQKIKLQGEELAYEILKSKFVSLKEDEKKMVFLRSAFRSLLNSDKCKIIDSSSKITEVISDISPVDLDAFDYNIEPIVLHLNDNFYCLFSEVIVKFDRKGNFITAYNPYALEIQINKYEVPLYVFEGEFPTHEYVSYDSKRISKGPTKKMWKYSRVDGGMDLRYKDNYLIDCRLDVYEYGQIIMKINRDKIVIKVSSERTLNALEKVKTHYANLHAKT